jgi:hypothetical protein
VVEVAEVVELPVDPKPRSVAAATKTASVRASTSAAKKSVPATRAKKTKRTH